MPRRFALFPYFLVSMAALGCSSPSSQELAGTTQKRNQAAAPVADKANAARWILVAEDKNEPDGRRENYARSVIREHPNSAEAIRAQAVLKVLGASALRSHWTYDRADDPMTGNATRSAVVMSENTLNFEFPYQGEQHGRLTVRKHPSHGSDVILDIEKGQILCSNITEDCPIRIRFDEGEPFTVTGREAADNSTTVVFLPNFKSLTQRMPKANIMRVQFNAYQQGAPILSFPVGGLDLKRLD